MAHSSTLARCAAAALTAVTADRLIRPTLSFADSPPPSLPALSPAPSPSVPYWLRDLSPDDAVATSTPSTARLPSRADVVVIGAGVAGASCAYHLALLDPTQDVVLLDARQVSGGASGRNGGFVHAHSFAEFFHIASTHGARTAFELIQFEQATRAALRAFCDAHGRGGELERDVDAVELYPSLEDLRGDLPFPAKYFLDLPDAVAAVPLFFIRALLGVDIWHTRALVAEHLNLHTRVVDGTGAPSGSTGAAGVQGEGGGVEGADEVEVEGGAEGGGMRAVRLRGACDMAWPAKIVAGLAREARRHGAQIYPHTRVLRVTEEVTGGGGSGGGDGGEGESEGESEGGAWRVETEGGETVICNTVVFATNAHTAALVPAMKDQIKQVKNHVLATRPGMPPLLSCNAGEEAGDGAKTPSGAVVRRCVGFSLYPGCHYFAQRPDGRIILGGFRNMLAAKGVGDGDDSARTGGRAGDPTGVVERASEAFLGTLFRGYGGGGSGGGSGKGGSGSGGGGGVQGGDESVVDCRWTGIIGWSCDGLPHVGPIPGKQRQFVCAGFSGHGLTQTFLCGQAVAHMVRGEAPKVFVKAFTPALARHGASWGSYEPTVAPE